MAQFAPRAIEECIASGNYNYLVALADGQLVGVLGVRDNRHLVHLFVAEPYQRRGIARRLWQRAKSDALAAEAEAEVSVRSSVYATAVYERFGVEVCGHRVDDVGVTWIPMRQVIRRVTTDGAFEP